MTAVIVKKINLIHNECEETEDAEITSAPCPRKNK